MRRLTIPEAIGIVCSAAAYYAVAMEADSPWPEINQIDDAIDRLHELSRTL